MSFFEELKTTIKERWLDYYQINRPWIKSLLDNSNNWVKTGDGVRPPSTLILGAITAIEPKFQELLLPFCQLNSDTNKLIDLLELNFDPGVELDKRIASAYIPQEAKLANLLSDSDTQYLNQIRETLKEENSK